MSNCTSDPIKFKGVTGLDAAQIAQMTERDTFLTAKEARQLGIVDHVVGEKQMACTPLLYPDKK